jgi:hypothetical protein
MFDLLFVAKLNDFFPQFEIKTFETLPCVACENSETNFISFG